MLALAGGGAGRLLERALGPTLVAWFVVFPLKGLPVAGGGHASDVDPIGTFGNVCDEAAGDAEGCKLSGDRLQLYP